MSVPGLTYGFQLPVTDLPSDFAEYIPTTGVAPIVEVGAEVRTYLMVAQPYDPNNWNLLRWTDDPTK